VGSWYSSIRDIPPRLRVIRSTIKRDDDWNSRLGCRVFTRSSRSHVVHIVFPPLDRLASYLAVLEALAVDAGGLITCSTIAEDLPVASAWRGVGILMSTQFGTMSHFRPDGRLCAMAYEC